MDFEVGDKVRFVDDGVLSTVRGEKGIITAHSYGRLRVLLDKDKKRSASVDGTWIADASSLILIANKEMRYGF